MIIYLVGLGCVGKTTIGKSLAEKMGFRFFDLDEEVENYYQKPIERIQDEHLTMDGFREKASVVLDLLFSKNIDSIVAGTPSGLKFYHLNVYKKHKADKDLHSIYLEDTCENILERLRFYDKDSKPLHDIVNDSNRKKYLRKLKEDYRYFKSSYKRADICVNIENIRLDDIPDLIIKELKSRKIL
jgi:shikimate kinase